MSYVLSALGGFLACACFVELVDGNFGWALALGFTTALSAAFVIADALLAHREKLAVGMIDQMKGERK